MQLSQSMILFYLHPSPPQPHPHLLTHTHTHTHTQWLSVQELWHNLEAVFGDPSTATEFPEEAVRFVAIDDRWGRIMQRAYETRNAMQVKNCLVLGSVASSLLS